MKFNYQARSKEGKIETGTIEASSKDVAANILQKYNITVVSINEQKNPFSFRGSVFFKKVSKKDLAIFSRQLAVMINARVPVVQSLLSLAAQTENPNFKEVIAKVANLVEEGNPLSDAFTAHSDTFGKFYTSLVRSGEASGKISESLYYLSDHLEREYDINSKIKGAMIYPILILSVMAVVIVIVMTVVMPKIVTLIREIGGNIPLTTQLLIGFYDFTINYGWIIMIALAGMIAFFIYYFRTKEGKKTYDRLMLKIPFVGGFLGKIFLVRFAENLSTLIAAGIPITSALKITKNTIGNTVYRRIVAETEQKVSEGEKISSVLIKYPERVPSFVVQMVKVGEETGQLENTLTEVVKFYQKEINRAVDTFITLIEPLLILFLGAGVAILAVSVIAPLYGSLNAI